MADALRQQLRGLGLRNYRTQEPISEEQIDALVEAAKRDAANQELMRSYDEAEGSRKQT